MGVRYKPTSHENFSHDSIDSLGYDWERQADPSMPPRFPLKVYLPQTTEDVIHVLNESRSLGETLRIRSRGHSSNDLVLLERGAVLCTEKLNRLIQLDPAALTVTIQAGMVLATLDEQLLAQGYGLPVVGDHDDITAGGFASVGGISPASLIHGLFVDNINWFEYVTWQGERVVCSKSDQRELFYRVLMGTGQHGVITTLNCRIIRIRKYETILENDFHTFRDLDSFIAHSVDHLSNARDTLMERGVWLDLPIAGRSVAFGQFSRYIETQQSPLKSLWNKLAYAYLFGLGYWAGRLPKALDMFVKLLGTIGMMLSPRYASIKHVERFTDKIIDSSVGDPSRMLILLAPMERYPELFRKVHDLCLEFRARYGCFTVLSFYLKGIQSDYLAGEKADKRFCEFTIYLGLNLKKLTPAIMDDLVSQLDDLCIAHQTFRYMHTKTVKDAERRRLIDPNTQYS